jgi:predicted hydrocarbon binding protein
MATTKGIGFVNVRTFVQERHGAQAWKDLIARFPPSERVVLGSIVSIGWYDLALYARLIRALDEKHGTGSLKLCYALGRYEADRDLTTIQAWFLRLFGPTTAIEQMGKYWRRFHDTGEWSSERRGDREIVARLAGWGVADAALCRELLGYLGRTLELLGGRDIALDHVRCCARNDNVCEFLLRWRTPKEVEAAGGSAELPPWMPPPTNQQSPQR